MSTVMEGCSSALRGIIVAPPGKKLVIADWSNIEGRAVAWLAKEEWKLQVFRDFDNGIGEDVYKTAYAKMFNIPAKEVTKAQRQVGKFEELSRAYGGGVGATVRFSIPYNIDLEALAEHAKSEMPPDILEEAREFLLWQRKEKRSQFGLSDNAYIVVDSLKRLWRNAHPHIVKYWKELETTCISATNYPGKTFTCFRHKVRRDKEWLRISLPSGRCLCYPSPRVEDGKLSYMGVNQFNRKWQRIRTYGGKLVENATQGFSRDVLAHFMPVMEDAGYDIIITVHDEPVTETPDTPEHTSEKLAVLMSVSPSWCPDLPLAAEGFETYRYCKPD